MECGCGIHVPQAAAGPLCGAWLAARCCCCDELWRFVGGAPAWLLGGAAGLQSELGHVVDPDGVELRGVAEMPETAVSPLLESAGGLLVLVSNLSFKAAKLEREICPGPRYLLAISQNCEVRSLALAMIPSCSAEISSILALALRVTFSCSSSICLSSSFPWRAVTNASFRKA